LQQADGSLCEVQEELETMAAEFYHHLFTTQEHIEPDLVTQHVLRRVTDLMNALLMAEFSSEEVKRAVFMMHPNKSPGIDNFTTGFYQRHWELIGGDISACLPQWR
jgi:hypothetical protein